MLLSPAIDGSAVLLVVVLFCMVAMEDVPGQPRMIQQQRAVITCEADGIGLAEAIE